MVMVNVLVRQACVHIIVVVNTHITRAVSIVVCVCIMVVVITLVGRINGDMGVIPCIMMRWEFKEVC
jgi:hypothetical protein